MNPGPTISAPESTTFERKTRRSRRLFALFVAASWATIAFSSGCSSTKFSSPSDAGLTASRSNEAAGDAATKVDSDAQPGTTGGVTVSSDLHFGAVNCGEAAEPQSVTVKNTGDRAFSVTAVLAGGESSPYAIALTTKLVPSKSQLAIKVTPKAIPGTSPVPGMYTDTLTVSTDLAGDFPHLVSLSETAQGSILSFDTQAIPFGEVPVSSAQSSTFHVMNAGNLPATVSLGMAAPASASFSVGQTSMTVANGDELTAEATFTPTSTGAQSSSVVLMPGAGTVLCAPLPAALTLTGVGENGGLAISSNALTFGPTACGTTAKTQTIDLTNTGNAPLTWSASVAGTSPSPYSLSPGTTGSLAAGASVTLTVTPGPIPSQSSVQANFYADSITLTTDVVGEEPHVVTLSQTASGAILAFNPSALDFGDVPIDTTGTAHLQVVNTGNAGAKVLVTASGSPFSVSPIAATLAGAGSQATFTGTFAPGSSTILANGTFSVTSTDPLCAPLPKPVPASGTGTSGVVAFAPGSLTFGNQPTSGFTACGTQATAQQVTFTNSGNQSYTITPTLGNGAASAYTVAVSPVSGVVAASGGVATVTVTPNAVPQTSAVPGSYDDTLSITTTASGDSSPHLIALTESAYGAILTGAPSSITFPDTPVAARSSTPVAITNSGNAPATLVWSGVSSSVFAFDANVIAPPGGVTTSPLAYFQPVAAQPYTGTATLGVAMATILCQPIPSTNVSLTGTGTNGSVVSVTPAEVDFNMVACGTSGGSDTVTIKNNSAGVITWSASIPASTGFTLGTPSSGMLASGASATVSVTSSVIPVNAMTTTAANGFGSQLTVTTNAPNDTSHVVPILETASGAILTFSPTNLDLPAMDIGSPVSYQVLNSGNVSASVTMTLNNPGPAVLTLDAPTSGMVSNGTPFQGAVTEELTSLPSNNATVSLAVASGTVLCQPAPAPMTLVAN